MQNFTSPSATHPGWIAPSLICVLFSATAMASVPDWENAAVTGINKEQPRSYSLPRADKTKSLNGKWKFQFSMTPDERPVHFYETGFDVGSWADLQVPSNWQLAGYGSALYTNVRYPFKSDAPRVMGEPPKDWTAYKERNSVGSYRRDFNLPASWKNDRVMVRFDGVESAFYVWVNGRKVGYSQDSYTGGEFDITPYVVPGKNTIAVEVYRWSDGSYLEDQDFMRLSGIFRDVTLFAQPQVHVRDVFFKTGLKSPDYTTGTLETSVTVRNSSDQNIPAGGKFSFSLTGLNTSMSWDGPHGARTIKTVNNQDLGSESITLPAIPAGKEVTITFNKEYPGVNAWSAETPNLYTATYSVNGQDPRSVNIGFRSVETAENGAVLINGKPVKFKGVNRHETHPDYGRAIPRSVTEQDIRIIKENNINTIRTSHYPNQPYLYELCDRYGIYVMDEANNESHGDQSISNKPAWEKPIVERVMNMVHRDKNHPSIVFWSMGNEAGGGNNYKAAAKAARDYDNSRKLHYCEFRHGEPAVDMDSIMYPTVDRVVGWGKEQTNRPFFVCEYAHAMGNALGNFKEYMDAFEASPRMIGGCIWDFVDQSLHARRDKDGIYHPAPFKSKTLAYGGMFGDKPNDGNFCDNGVILGDRSATAKLKEVKHVYQYAGFRTEGNSLTITNKYFHKNLKDAVLTIIVPELRGTGKNAIQFMLPEMQSGASATLELPSFLTAANGQKYPFLALLSEKPILPELAATPPSPKKAVRRIAGKDQPFGQSADLTPAQVETAVNKSEAYQYFAGEARKPVPAVKAGKQDTLTFNPDEGTVTGKNFKAVFKDGMLSGLSYAGRDMILPGYPIALQAYRAPVDNDKWIDGKWNRGKLANLKSECIKTEMKQVNPQLIQVISDMKTVNSNPSFTYRMVWNVLSSGVIDVSAQIYPSADGEELPRLGFSFGAPASYDTVSYLGLGPWDNYRDRKTSTWRDTFTKSVDDMFFAYSRPQEMGNRTGVEWLSIGNGQTPGLVIGAASPKNPMEASVSYYTAQELNAAQALDKLPPKDKVIVNLDAFQMGLGGASCGPRPLMEYQTFSKPTAFGFILAPDRARLDTFLSQMGGAVNPPVISRDSSGLVSLESSTPEATMTYSIDNGPEQTYTQPFPLEQGTVTAKAAHGKIEGLSPASTRTFNREVIRTGWKIQQVSSEEPGEGVAQHAIDGKPNTFWHTSYTNGQPGYPHSIAVDMGRKERFKGFTLTPRADMDNGLVQNFSFYVSDDGANWRKVMTGSLPYKNRRAPQQVILPRVEEARYFRLDAIKPVHDGQPWAAIAELNIIPE